VALAWRSSQTFHEMFAAAGKRTFLKARAMYVGSQRFPTTFYSDSYDYRNYLLGVVNSGWGGWVWAPEVRAATGPSDFCRRSQLMFWAAVSSMDGWNTGFKPFPPDVDAESSAMFVRLAKNRAKLLPFLYSAWNRQNQTGVPVARALTVDFEADIQTYTIDDQFLLGDGIMVAPADVNATNRSVYFPVGAEWVDYWNASAPPFAGGTTAVVQAPMREIPVFQRKGSVVMFDEGDHLVLRVTSDGQNSSTVLFDDDGATTRAETHHEKFSMRLNVNYVPPVNGSKSVLLQATPDHLQWQPQWWPRLVWELHGAHAGAAVECSGAHGSVALTSPQSASQVSVKWAVSSSVLRVSMDWGATLLTDVADVKCTATF
jgi:hypothetical protein